MRLNKLLGLSILCIGLTLTSCSIEDGKDGIDGIDGLDGKDGANGQDGASGEDGAPGEDGAAGQDGEDGVGINSLAEYGWVSLELSGTRPDEIAFEESSVFLFTPNDPEDWEDYNIVEITPIGSDTEHFFNFRRYLSTPNTDVNNNFVDWEVSILNLGEQSESIQSIKVFIKHGILDTDNKYFMINDEYQSGGTGVSEMVITDLTFNPEDRYHLFFNY
jgi:Collagen triple helix repeat (20 copies).